MSLNEAKRVDIFNSRYLHFSFSCIGEGNGNPLQCSCVENPRDGGAWWAAVYGGAQSQARLKWLSSSSSSNDKILLWHIKCLLWFVYKCIGDTFKMHQTIPFSFFLFFNGSLSILFRYSGMFYFLYLTGTFQRGHKEFCNYIWWQTGSRLVFKWKGK